MNPSLMMPEEGMSVDELSNFVAEQLKRLNLVLKSIDGLNIVDIKFELQGGAYIQLNRKGLTFFDGTKKTFTVDVNGVATLTGVKVQSGDGAFPRIEFSSANKLLQAFLNATNSIYISPSYTGNPSLVFDNGTITAFMAAIGNLMALNAMSGDLQLYSQTGDLLLKAGGGTKKVKVDSWNDLYGTTNTQSLQQALDAKANKSNYSGVFSYVKGVNFVAQTYTTGEITVTNGVIISVT